MKFQTAFDTIASFLVRNNATTLPIARAWKPAREKERKPAAVIRTSLMFHRLLPRIPPLNSKRDQQIGRVRLGHRMKRKPSLLLLVSTMISTVLQMNTVGRLRPLQNGLLSWVNSKSLMTSPVTSNTVRLRQKRKVEHTHLVKLGDGNSQTAYILRSYHDFYREADTDQACEADRNYLCEADAACLRR